MLKKLDHNLHFIGIGGTGMRPLAEIAKSRGYSVSGSDQNRSEAVQRLERLGIPIQIGHSEVALPKQKATVILSSAIKEDNPEWQLALKNGWPVLHRSDLLVHLLESQRAICVSGTHGKTSTTAMLAFMLDAMGLHPTAAIGGELCLREQAAMLGSGPYFVAECDESDGTFLKYKPFISIVTNVDLDHLDFYKNLDGLKRGFQDFVSRTSPEGCAIIGWDNPTARDIAENYKGPRLTFGTRIGSEVRGLSFRNQGLKAYYEAIVDKQLIRSEAELVGRHNFQNILCCLAVAAALELDLEHAAHALKSYPGVKRRFSHVGDVGPIRIFDDYAHNPGKIKSCLEGAREAFPGHRLIVLFQPHRYSRLETMYNELMASFSSADLVTVLPVYTAGETSGGSFSPWSIARDITQASKVAAAPYIETELEFELTGTWRPTVLVTIGAGDVWELGLKWKEQLLGLFTQKGSS